MSTPCSSNDNIDIEFDDEATSTFYPCPATDGNTYISANPLSAFDGQEMSGTWKLEVQDGANGDGGSLDSWGLQITYSCSISEICNDNIDNDGDGDIDCDDADCGKPNITAVSPINPSVCSSNGSITITASGSNLEYSIDSGSTYQSANTFGTLAEGVYQVIVRNSSTGCFESYGNVSLTDSSCSSGNCNTTENSNNIPILIDAGAPNTSYSNIVIPVSGSLVDINILNLDITHSYLGDLRILLIAPDLTEIIVMNQVCGSNDDIDGGIDDSAAAAPSCPPTSGVSFTPSNPLSGFNGLEINGTWQLKIEDLANDDGGALNSWSLEIVYNCTSNEICNDNIDNDGDGDIDCDDADCGQPIITSVSPTNPSNCPTLDNGSITILASGSNLEYSIDNGTTYQTSNSFTGLSDSDYTVVVRNSATLCLVNYATNDITLTDPSCIEICDDGIDNDGDGDIDCDDADCGQPIITK